jgi:hypothetical protein
VFFVICNYYFKLIQGPIAKEFYSSLFYLLEFFPVRLFHDFSLLAVAAEMPVTRRAHPDPVVQHSRSRFLGCTRSSAPLIHPPILISVILGCSMPHRLSTTLNCDHVKLLRLHPPLAPF